VIVVFEIRFMAREYFPELHKGSTPESFKLSQVLRRHETSAEKILWQYLRNRKLCGKKFRRQHTILKYVLDFYCHECKLAIELDGQVHLEESQKKHDEERTAWLNDSNIRVIRFKNEEVFRDLFKVLKKISSFLV